MMSLTGTNVLAVAWKQYRFKTKIHAIKFIILLAAQLLALLFSFSGVVTSGFYSETITYTIRCISGDIIIVFTLIWAFVIGYNMSNSLKQDFTFVSNRLSSHLSSIAFLLASAILAGVTATLCGILLRVLAVLVQGGQNYSGLFIPPLDLVSGIYAAILYALLVSAGGYLFGMLVQKNWAFLVLIPGLLLGTLFVEARTTGQTRLLINAVYFFIKESSHFLFFLKVFLTAVLLFGLVILFSNRMEVRK
jgi:hypothetical protein